jgi:ligand-binding sensor domain-containing protein
MVLKRVSTFTTVLVLLLMSVIAFVPTQGTAALPQAASCSPDEGVWIGTFGFGLNCLDEAGWHAFIQGKGSVGNNLVKTVVVCPDKRVWAAHALGLSVYDGKAWTEVKTVDFASAETLACGADGNIWMAHFKGLSRYDGKAWTKIEAEKLGTGKNVSLVKDVAVAADGKVWVMTSNSVAMVDGENITIHENGKGFDKEIFFDALAVDSKGTVWAAHSQGVFTFDGKAWTDQKVASVSQAQAIVIDAKDQVWIGTYAKGISLFDGKDWKTFDRKGGALSSDQVRSLAVDGQGRVWAGTDYGLDVFDGTAWKTYFMHNSDLLDNSVYGIAILGNGPKLPDPKEKKPGTVTGIIENGTDPVKGTQVELCGEAIGILFRGATPCEGQAYSQLATTDDKGMFTFKDVPVGRYTIVVQGVDAEKKWIRFSGLDAKFEVKEGAATDLKDIDISNVK